ncbi:glycosyltransferase family 4 protein [Amnibacterium kyonggiense]|uniref:Glycosyltransferase involved in cell wall biosynthesis n=1 Tax=Amnibacterium kyonggiense TaxID=595671 RepID=A0A4R7FPU8_9MICO|nr:glycosyltransferase family 4 protein [Amnibacterium kyonggiense]TDS79668.1 glycosyltransferase involved in cell wall biosynthesis [Amnibacterium kyonggiense]
MRSRLRPRVPRRDADGGPRVLLVCGRLDPEHDGVGDYVARLAAGLRSRGAAVRILHVGAPSGTAGARRVGRVWGPTALLRAAGASRGADVVHVQFAPSMYRFRPWIGALPLATRGRAVVTTLHEYGWWRWERLLPAAVWERLESARIADRETALLVPGSRAVVTTNAGHGSVLQERFAGGPLRTTIPIGANVEVDAELDRADARDRVRTELGIPAAATVVAFFGFVHPVKGLRYLAEALAQLSAEGREVHAIAIGGVESLALPGAEATAFEAELRGQIAAAGAAERLHLTGFAAPREVSRLLAAADAGVLPFTHGVTPKSGSLLTLLAHGLPTVVTAGEGTAPDLVDGDRVVVVDRVRDGAALAAGIRRVIDRPELAAEIAARGRAWSEEHDWSVIADRHLELYERVA